MSRIIHLKGLNRDRFVYRGYPIQHEEDCGNTWGDAWQPGCPTHALAEVVGDEIKQLLVFSTADIEATATDLEDYSENQTNVLPWTDGLCVHNTSIRTSPPTHPNGITKGKVGVTVWRQTEETFSFEMDPPKVPIGEDADIAISNAVEAAFYKALADGLEPDESGITEQEHYFSEVNES